MKKWNIENLKEPLKKWIATKKGRIVVVATTACVGAGAVIGGVYSLNNENNNSNNSGYESYLEEDDKDTDENATQVPEEPTETSKPNATQVPEEPTETSKTNATQVPEEPTETSKPNATQIPEESTETSKPNATQIPEESTETSKPNATQVPEEPTETNKPNATQVPEEPTVTNQPTITPKPSETPSTEPSDIPSVTPKPSKTPSTEPSDTPSVTPKPSETPSTEPSDTPKPVTPTPSPVISTGKVTVGESFWDSLLKTITFGIYQSKNVEVTITSSNKDDFIEYYIYEVDNAVTGAGLTAEELDTKEFSKYKEDAKPVLEKETNVVVYVRITSSTGNVTYISTNGLIINENGLPPTLEPSETPSTKPSETPSTEPSESPSTEPSETPSAEPSETPSATPKPNFTLKIGCTTGGAVELDGNSVEFSNNFAEKIVELGNYTLKAVPAEGYKFVGWVDHLERVVSTEIEYKISVAGETTISAKFAEIQTTVNVTYSHENGEVILHEAVKFGETLTPPTSNVWRSDKTFAGWKLNDVLYEGSYGDTEFYSATNETLSSAIQSLTSNKQNVQLVSYYIANPITYYDVSVSGGSITVSGVEVSPGAIEAGTKIKVTADVPEGYVFAYWTDGNGKIISYDTVYSIVVKTNLSLTAVFSKVAVEKEPVLYFFGDQYSVDVSHSAVTLFMSCDIPSEKYTKEEWGFLYSTKLEDSEMVLESRIGKVTDNLIESKNALKVNYTYHATFSQNMFSSHKLLKVRVYAVLKDKATGDEIIIYSDILKVQL